MQIALLLAEGRTTRQTAAALFIMSPKTVEYHLRHVHTKLGIDSRRALAAGWGGSAPAGMRDRSKAPQVAVAA